MTKPEFMRLTVGETVFYLAQALTVKKITPIAKDWLGRVKDIKITFETVSEGDIFIMSNNESMVKRVVK